MKAASQVHGQHVFTTQFGSVEVLAARYNIQLPSPEQVPKGYGTLRAWLHHRIATLEGKHSARWQRVKEDPSHLAHIRAQNKRRVQAYQARKALSAVGPRLQASEA